MELRRLNRPGTEQNMSVGDAPPDNIHPLISVFGLAGPEIKNIIQTILRFKICYCKLRQITPFQPIAPLGRQLWKSKLPKRKCFQILEWAHDSIMPPVFFSCFVTKFVWIQFGSVCGDLRFRYRYRLAVDRPGSLRSPSQPTGQTLDSDKFGNSTVDQTCWLDWIITSYAHHIIMIYNHISAV